MGEFQIGTDLTALAPESLLLLLCLHIATAIFLWYLAWYEWVWGNPHSLQYSVIILKKSPVLLGVITCGLL